MNTIGLECLECRSLDAIALGLGLALLDMVSRTRLLSWLVVRYMTVCSYKEQMAAVQGPLFTILR